MLHIDELFDQRNGVGMTKMLSMYSVSVSRRLGARPRSISTNYLKCDVGQGAKECGHRLRF